MSDLPQLTLETRLRNAIFHDFAQLDLVSGRVTYSSDGIGRMIGRVIKIVEEELEQQKSGEVKHADIDL